MRNPSLTIDWQRVILNLRGVVKTAHIEKKCGSNWQHISRLARGDVESPNFETGLRILALHAELCPEQHSISGIGVADPVALAAIKALANDEYQMRLVT